MQCQLYFAPTTAIYRIQQDKKNVFNGLVVPQDLAVTPHSAFLLSKPTWKRTEEKEKGEKRMQTIMGYGHWWDCIVTFRLMFLV